MQTRLGKANRRLIFAYKVNRIYMILVSSGSGKKIRQVYINNKNKFYLSVYMITKASK